MVQISFLKDKKIINCAKGENLMRTLLQNSVPVASSCKGDAVCGKCKLIVCKGAENLSMPTQDESSLARRENIQLDQFFRYSCQVQVLGDIQIDAPYW